uniref:Uncharacterized protein n=1 Tax=Tetraselmis sp. GSL018 TaxID=582737 RepID=A0A061SFR6_9CHLO
MHPTEELTGRGWRRTNWGAGDGGWGEGEMGEWVKVSHVGDPLSITCKAPGRASGSAALTLHLSACFCPGTHPQPNRC